jgi:hypothetical protein
MTTAQMTTAQMTTAQMTDAQMTTAQMTDYCTENNPTLGQMHTMTTVQHYNCAL